MVIEKQHIPTTADIDAIRLSAIRMRLLSQEWAGDSVTELMQALVKFHSLPLTISQQQYRSLASLILAHLDRFAAAAQAASTFNDVIAEEHKTIANSITQSQQKILQEEAEVKSLREKLQREKSQVDRRAQYDALAKLILECPPCQSSQKELEDARNEAKLVSEEVKHLEDTRETVQKELTLLAHCAARLEQGTNLVTSLMSNQDNRLNETRDAMDTSM